VGFLTGWLAAGQVPVELRDHVRARGRDDRRQAVGRRADRSPRRLLARRYAFLLVLGLAHMFLLFPGDILFSYGSLGLVLLAFVGVRSRTALWWAGGILGVLLVLGVGLHRARWARARTAGRRPGDRVDGGLLRRAGRAAPSPHTRTAPTSTSSSPTRGRCCSSRPSPADRRAPWVVALFLFGFAVGAPGSSRTWPPIVGPLRRTVASHCRSGSC
jgi:hypothetical protein